MTVMTKELNAEETIPWLNWSHNPLGFHDSLQNKAFNTISENNSVAEHQAVNLIGAQQHDYLSSHNNNNTDKSAQNNYYKSFSISNTLENQISVAGETILAEFDNKEVKK